jgi:hypothetical protein
VYDQDGKPVKAPKVCTAKDLEKMAKAVTDATKQATTLNKAAVALRQSAVALKAQAAKAIGTKAKLLTGLATAADWAAAQLEKQAVTVVEKANVKTCIVLPPGGGSRF